MTVASGAVVVGRRVGADLVVGAVAGGVTFAFYVLGAGRNYDYDSSQTVGTFVATPSLLDPFRRQTVFNNHPLLSFVDHLVYSAGGHGPAALRMLPIVFGAVAVGLVAGWVSRWWGIVAGACAGALLAANPLFAFSARSVRGYSLLTLSAIASTMLLARLLRREQRAASVGYVLVVAAGVATHLYALIPLAAQVAAVASRRAFTRLWAVRFTAALALGGLAYVQIAPIMFRAARRQPHRFRPRFPLTLAHTILGGTSVAIAAVAVLALVGFVALRRRETTAAAVLLIVAFAAIWLWLRPVDLYPRFFVWLAAAVALLAGAAVGRWRSAALLVVAATVALVRVDAHQWIQNPLPDRQAAQLVTAARALRDRPCVLPWIQGSLLAYTRAPHEVTRADELGRCDLVIGSPIDPPRLRQAARRELPDDWILSARTPYIVYARVSRSTLLRHHHT